MSGIGPTFEKSYPDTAWDILNNRRMQELGLKYSDLKTREGWAAYSKARYGSDQFAEPLKDDLNGGAGSPMDTMNSTQKFFCWLSDRYCAPMIKIRIKPLKEAVETPAPKVAAKVEEKPADTKPARQRKDAGPVSGVSGAAAKKIVLSLSAKSAPAGTEGDLILSVAGDIPKGEEPKVDISGGNVEISGLQVSTDGKKYRFHITVDPEAEVGTRYITLSIDGEQVGKGVPFKIIQSE